MLLNYHFDRAYINIDQSVWETKDNKYMIFDKLNFMSLIRAVAIANPFGDGDEVLFDNISHKVYEKRTKEYIVKKTKIYILGITQCFCAEENMATYVSLRQLKYLIRAFEKTKKRISCYAPIYVYIIYILLKDKSSQANDCLDFAKILHSYVRDYFFHFPEDKLAIFFLECYEKILAAIENENATLDAEELPSIPRNNPNEDTD